MASYFSSETLPILFRTSQKTTYRSHQPRSPTSDDSDCLQMESNNNQCSQSDIHVPKENKPSSSSLTDQQLISKSKSEDSSCSSSSGQQQHPEGESADRHNNNDRAETSSSAAAADDNIQSINCIKKVTTMIGNNPIVNRLLRQTVLADKLSNYQLLHIISLNAKYAFLALLAVYIVILTVFWIPCWILSRVISELGVYALFLTCLVYGGRCLLRLLAFPGTNVRVYGEIELEFARYSCKMLDGTVDAMDDFVKCLLSCSSSSSSSSSSTKKSAKVLGNDDYGGWSASDIPATYKRMKVYRDRVLGVYWQVLHCLLEENGHGLITASSSPLKRNSNGGSSFYRLGGACCDRRDMSASELGLKEHPEKGATTLERTIASNTLYGNNPLQGDIGNMANLTPKAKSDGRALYNILTSILGDFSTLEDSLSNNVLRNIDNKAQLKTASISEESQDLAIKLMGQMDELKQLVKTMRPVKKSKSPFPTGEEEESDHDDDDSDVGPEAVRHHLEEQSASSSPTPMGMISSTIEAFFDMIDPKPHKYIFGLDVIRGCVLARHRGARQFWVQRGDSNACGGNGKIDVIVIPSLVSTDSDSRQDQIPLSPRDGRLPLNTAERNGRKAVLYCNPNAGLSEVATGMGLTSGNVDDSGNAQGKDPSQRSWTEYYTSHGYDIYLFNYAGYGRSYGGSSCNQSSPEFAPGFVGAMKRIIFSTFIGFTPSSESLKADATAVAKHIVHNIGVDQLIIHGESIGGMSAAGAARALTAERSSNVSLLVCDRTFCNLNAVAQRLVGGWTGNAINLLTPTWSTDVAHDFLAAKCAKIVANDASDEIIHDHSSLKSGISFAKELKKGSTNNVGWMMMPPLQYRMADLTSQALPAKNPPTWPSDKHISFVESFHFAACARRVGKLATAAKKQAEAHSVDEEGIELAYLSDESSTKSTRGVLAQTKTSSSTSSALIQMWTKLSCCDGLCGAPLGASVKEGMDVTISWLTSVLVYGSHVLAKNAEKRLSAKATNPSNVGLTGIDPGTFQIEDFDSRPVGHDDSAVAHAIPIPEVLSSLRVFAAENVIPEVENELEYIIGCLTYVVSRLTSKENGIASTNHRFDSNHGEDNSVGCFLNLHCGHNNHYSTEERDQLMSLIRRFCDGDPV